MLLKMAFSTFDKESKSGQQQLSVWMADNQKSS